MPPASNTKPKYRVALTIDDLNRLKDSLAQTIANRKDSNNFEEVIACMQLDLQLAKMIGNITGGTKSPDTNYVPESQRKVSVPITAESLGLDYRDPSYPSGFPESRPIIPGRKDSELIAAMSEEEAAAFWAKKMADHFLE